MELNENQVKKATSALLEYFKKVNEEQLITEENSPVWLVLSTKIPNDNSKVKPIRIPLKYPVITKESEICLITKDPQSDYKQMLQEQGINRITKVIGVTKLRKKYKPYEAKRLLCNSYDVFIADDRVIPLLPKLIGKTFYERKKQPIPIKIKKNSLLKEITNTLDSTYLFINSGSCSSIKVGLTNQTTEQITENIMYSINHIVSKIPGKWKNVQRLSIKTNKSVALPIYSSLPEEAIKINIHSTEEEKKEAKKEKKEKVEKKDEEKEEKANEEVDDDNDDDDEKMGESDSE